MATSRGAASSGNGIFSSLSSLFNSTGLGDDGRNTASSSSSARPPAARKGSSFFGGGFRKAPFRGPGGNDDAAWTLPSHSNTSSPRASGVMNGSEAYANTPGVSPSPYSSFMPSPLDGSANASSSTLVPGQARPSMSLTTKVAIPSTAYPPLKHTWRRIRTWCNKNYTELSDTLNWAATETQLEDLELEIGYSLPSAVRESYLCYDGQELESHQSCSDGLFFGLPLMSLEQVAEEWRFWRGVDEDPTSGANAEVRGWMNSCPAGWVRSEYSCRGWIPLITDRVGNYVGVDLSPQPDGGGAPGQVILFGRDFDTKIVLWRGEGEGGWGRFLQSFAEELEAGDTWTLESEISSDSNDEEDGIGYESYYAGDGGGHGGGDRGGDGAASFKLRGEYKGWPVLEAWADRSMRSWEEIGMPVGQPTWRVDPPRVVLPDELDSESYNESVQEYGFDEGAEASSSRRYAAPNIDDSLASEPDEGLSTMRAHPLETTADSSVSDIDANTRDTLSPPPSRNFGNRQRAKQRDEGHGADNASRSPSHTPTQRPRPRKPVPVPAAPLDLPTIDDVRAAHAAALASQRPGSSFHYDADRARPPAGSGGQGMGMGSGSLPSYVPRYSSGLSKSSTGRRSGSSSMAPDNRPRLAIPEEDGVELENRISAEYTKPLKEGVSSEESSNDIVVDMAPHASNMYSSTNGARTPTIASRTLYAAGSATPSTGALPLSPSPLLGMALSPNGAQSSPVLSSSSYVDASEQLYKGDEAYGYSRRAGSASLGVD